MRRVSARNGNSTLVIVVTFNAEKYIDACLQSIDYNKYDVVVIDNASSDSTVEKIKSSYPQTILIEQTINLGFGQANNIGLRMALSEGYDYIVLLNQDAWLLPDTIECLISSMIAHPEYWILSPVQYHSAINDIEPQFRKYLMRSQIPVEDGNVHEIKFANAAIWLLKREHIEDVGGFDPLFPHYGEDDDYINRCKAKGGKIGVDTLAKAYHDRNLSIEKPDYNRIKYLTKLSYFNMIKRQNSSLRTNIWRFFRQASLMIGKALSKGDIRLASARIDAAFKSLLSVRKIIGQRQLSMNKKAFLE